MSAVVRDWLALGGSGAGEGGRPPSAEVAADVLAKCGLLQAAAEEEEEGDGDEQQQQGRPPPQRALEPEPYFCPMEYLYLSEPIIQRHHRAAPLTRREHGHFAVGDLSEVEMEAIPDHGAAAVLAPSASSGSLGASAASSASAAAAAAAAHHRPQPPSAPSSGAAAPPQQPLARPRPPGPRGAASLLGAAQRPQEKPRLKVIQLDQVKVSQSVSQCRVGWVVKNRMERCQSHMHACVHDVA